MPATWRPAARLALALGGVLVLAAVAGAFEPVIDAPMYADPALPVGREIKVFPEKAKDLWARALDRPEVDLRCRAADAVARAHRRGVRGLETTVGPLLAALDRPDQDPTVRVAVARALVA